MNNPANVTMNARSAKWRRFSTVPPLNDTCAGAITVSGSTYANTQSTASATSTGDPAPTCVAGFGKGVWYEYTPAANGQTVVDTIGGDFDTGLAAYIAPAAR